VVTQAKDAPWGVDVPLGHRRHEACALHRSTAGQLR
jgi:hypothetical protein